MTGLVCFCPRCSRSSLLTSCVANCRPTKPSTACVGWLRTQGAMHRPVRSTTDHFPPPSTARPTSERRVADRQHVSYRHHIPRTQSHVFSVETYYSRRILGILVHLAARETLPSENSHMLRFLNDREIKLISQVINSATKIPKTWRNKCS